MVKHYPGFVNNLLHFLSHSSNKLDPVTGKVGDFEKAGGHVKEVAICFPLDKDLIVLQVLVSQLVKQLVKQLVAM